MNSILLLLPFLLGFIPVCHFQNSTLLTEDDIVEALQKGVQRVKELHEVEETVTDEDERTSIHSQKPNFESRMEQHKGDILMEATKILIEAKGPEILSELANINLDDVTFNFASKKVKRNADCPKESADCGLPIHRRFRSITGVCNNKVRASLGKAVSPTRRLLNRNSYSDGIGAVRFAVSGALLPSARLVSNRLHAENGAPLFATNTNHFHMQYGQFIAHDIVFMPSSVAPRGRNLDCSSCRSRSSNCDPIRVPADDTFFPRSGCMQFTRALNGQQGLGVRTQINQNTHFLDLSAVYGSEECEGASVRTFVDGLLKEHNHFGSTLPPQAPNDTNCRSGSPNFCFLAGDFRNSLQPGLIPLHAVYIKEHNRIAREFGEARRRWSDERIFQETRRFMIARHQHHVYNEYLPKVLSPEILQQFDLVPETGRTRTRVYSPEVDPSLTNEFTAAAFRFGHSQARSDLPRTDNNNNTRGAPLPLGDHIFHAESLYDRAAGGAESMLHGMMNTAALNVDRHFSSPMRDQMFEIRGRPASGVDLVSVNIQRGRDLGILPYNEYRTVVGLRRANTFDDLLDSMTIENVNALRGVYANVNDIDLYTGLLMERPEPGAMLGKTGSHILAEGFSALKKGDRFFYDHRADGTRQFSLPELEMIRKSRLSKMYCTVTDDMAMVRTSIFDLRGPQVRCSSIEQVSIAPFLASERRFGGRGRTGHDDFE